jgi:putative hydrolase of the HAD superfamily
MPKPDAEVFEFILKENNIPRENLLFVDDSLQHIHGAAACQIQTFHLQKGEKIESELLFLL